MGRETAAEHLRAGTPEILRAYRTSLQALGSHLVSREDIWRQCRHQATNIIAECAESLRGGSHSESPGVGEYSRLLGAHRALQQVPVSESVRAAGMLWQAMQDAVAAAIAEIPADERAEALQQVSVAFNAVTGVRLYQGIKGYEEMARTTADADAGTPHPPPGPEPDSAEPQALKLLTVRERQMLEEVQKGLTNRQIGRRFEISEATVKRHLHNAYRKLGVGSRVQAINMVSPPTG